MQNDNLKVGIILPLGEHRMDGVTARWPDLLQMTQRAEELGFDSVWLVDHLLVESSDEPPIGVWECWSLLASLAAVTRRVELGTLVLCNSFRNPALLAKMAETVDEICGGRLILGLGAGHHEPEYRAFGYPFDHRVSRFAEGIEIISNLLRHGEVDFDGRWYQARDCVLKPRGPRAQGPPIMIGTTGPKMLGLTARFADQWNVYFDKTGNHVAGLVPLIEQLDAACFEVGRDPDTLERSASVLIALEPKLELRGVNVRPLSGNLDVIARELRAYADLGISHIQIRVEPNTVESIEKLEPLLGMLR